MINLPLIRGRSLKSNPILNEVCNVPRVNLLLTIALLALIMAAGYTVHALSARSARAYSASAPYVEKVVPLDRIGNRSATAATETNLLSHQVNPSQDQSWSEQSGPPAHDTPLMPLRLFFKSTSITIEQGTRLEVEVRRSGGPMGDYQLGLTPSSGSNIQVSGGLFRYGRTTTVIGIEALKNARSGSIAIRAESEQAPLTVWVRPR